MKEQGKYLLIQIPCLNEEETLPEVVNDIKEVCKDGIEGIAKIEIMVIDDGSTDKTIEIAKKLGVNHIFTHSHNSGLGIAFKTGMEKALMLGADILIQTDGDHQYPAKYIPELVKPIVNNEADIVTADRNTSQIKHFSPLKKILQKLGSMVVRSMTKTKVKDTVTGYRAYSRRTLIELNITSRFSYVLDSIVQAESKRMRIKEILTHTNPPTRKSRLFKNMLQHIMKSTGNLLTVFLIYHSKRVFLSISILSFLIAIAIGLRYVYILLFTQDPGAHIQSLLLASILFSISMNAFVVYLLSILITKNRELIEDILTILKKFLISKHSKDINS